MSASGAPRAASIDRRTNETTIAVTLGLDGSGRHAIATGVPFFDHLLTHVAVHGLFDLTVQAQGDLQIDEHHTVEDVAIVLGQALDRALGDRRGIRRMGYAYVPMDEALAFVAVDLSGRPYTVVEAAFSTPSIGALGTSLVPHVLESLATHARMNLHARVLYGRDDHHKAEALFKALGRALRDAVEPDPRRADVPSTKGVL
ncbi:MAG: imidazoleglycerol-phosphate dehydratase HisB [Chloroflexi bacterium]|nr:imidazoleglycerol-phosphate dehydratase HisB [Chloroflexota bacterium]